MEFSQKEQILFDEAWKTRVKELPKMIKELADKVSTYYGSYLVTADFKNMIEYKKRAVECLHEANLMANCYVKFSKGKNPLKRVEPYLDKISDIFMKM